ncbi:MAG: hypothetical protein IKP02_00700 [Paludibacteraceae bacterium]|nr:hypothetical protein [Paludibacteraceae bacterium]
MLVCALSLFAGDIERVSATYEYISDNSNETPAQVEAKAFERAKQKALFSPNTFSKANDRKSGTNWRDEPMPRQLSYEAFLKWLADNQKKDPSMVVRTSVISVRK